MKSRFGVFIGGVMLLMASAFSVSAQDVVDGTLILVDDFNSITGPSAVEVVEAFRLENAELIHMEIESLNAIEVESVESFLALVDSQLDGTGSTFSLPLFMAQISSLPADEQANIDAFLAQLDAVIANISSRFPPPEVDGDFCALQTEGLFRTQGFFRTRGFAGEVPTRPHGEVVREVVNEFANI